MSYFLETIKTTNEGKDIAEVTSYPDDMTAAVFYHSACNTNIREVQSGNLKAFYANIHNVSGVIIRQERWSIPEPAPEPEVVEP